MWIGGLESKKEVPCPWERRGWERTSLRHVMYETMKKWPPAPGELHRSSFKPIKHVQSFTSAPLLSVLHPYCKPKGVQISSLCPIPQPLASESIRDSIIFHKELGLPSGLHLAGSTHFRTEKEMTDLSNSISICGHIHTHKKCVCINIICMRKLV